MLGTGGVPLSILAEVVDGHLIGVRNMATTNDLKNGMTLNLDGNLMNVVEFQHVKPGKGGAFVRTRLKNVRTGRTLDKTFRADEPVEVAILEKRRWHLYRDETGFVFMDTQTYDQPVVEADAVGGAASWLTDSATPYVTFYEGTAIGVELPAAVELEVTETEPGIKGDRVSGVTKPATVETGAVVQVPLFVETGDRVKVDTRSGVPDPGAGAGRWSRPAPARRPGRRALDILFEADLLDRPVAEVLDRHRRDREAGAPTPTPSSWSRASPATWTTWTPASPPPPSTGRSSGCRWSTATCSAWPPSS